MEVFASVFEHLPFSHSCTKKNAPGQTQQVHTSLLLFGHLLYIVSARVGIFFPSFLFIPLIHPAATCLRQAAWTAMLLDGVTVAALALISGVLIQLGQYVLFDVLTWAVALLSLLILLSFKPNSVWLILVGAAIGLLRFWVLGRSCIRKGQQTMPRAQLRGASLLSSFVFQRSGSLPFLPWLLFPRRNPCTFKQG